MPEAKLSEESLADIRAHIDAALDDWATRVFTPETAELFWASAFTALQKQAQQQTGKLVFSSLSAVVRRFFLLLLIGGLIYVLLGWPAMLGFVKAWHSSGGA